MSIPNPIYPLTGHCSVVYNGTLYVYSPAGFQSLDLKGGASWKAMPMDISLTGAQCVKAVPKNGGDPMLYVVGGTVNATAATWDYPGLMHYSFAQKKWDWLRAESWVTQNRQNHAAAYLPESNSLLVYAGSQTAGNVELSSSTFLMSLTSPFYVTSTPANDAPPALKPMLMPWNDTSSVMIGGGAHNQAVFLFSKELGWRNLGVTLTEPIANPEAVQCTIVKGSDGSAVLEKYDLSTTPNKVSRIALLSKGGAVAAPGTVVGSNSKRATINGWPAYNGTYAPKVTRSGYSIAQGENAEAVITGGSEEDPLCIFDQQSNAWVNATSLFASEQVIIQSSPSSTVASTTGPTATASTSTPSASAESVIPAPAAANNKSRMLTVLGATLGAIFGIAAILILLLFCLKYRKNKNRKGQQAAYIEKDRLSFADRGADYMSEAGGAHGNNYNSSMNASQSSLAIVSGRTGTNHKRGLGSDASTAGLVTKKSPLGYSEPVELSKFDLKPEPILEEKLVRQNSSRAVQTKAANIGRSRSSGWSKYFANNEATNLAHMPSGRSTYASERTSTGSQSNYTESRIYNHPSQAIPPLEIPKFDGQRLSRVPTGSPTLGNSRENLPVQAMQAELGRANSSGSARSGYSHEAYYARGPVESWTPVGRDGRPPSSTYTNSVVIDNNDNREGASTYFPDNTSSFYPKSNYSSFYPGQPKLALGLPDDRESTYTMFPGGVGEVGKGHPDSFYPPPPKLPGQGAPDGRESTFTVFPGAAAAGQDPSMAKQKESFFPDRPPPRIPGFGHPQERESTVTVFPRDRDTQAPQDMSWLNLGAGK
ncbi:hypothetical protein B0J11DRAFT_445289 [Dendryphion nanum]|uniref:Pre-mRNA splicing factor CLF1 n=1 Tax=Dendryphion nanum TaxID=256645 RepID=A0A9P9D661_9PLEO|nr:hypothetical protein B0J11DRAFT_445289 [Dendryphion nanum]